MINNVVLVGRLTRNPELRTTGSGISVATFTLAVDRDYKNQNGQREADFINCVAYKETAENLCNWANKGRLTGVEGRIQTRSYDDKDGKRVYVTEVVVHKFNLLDSQKAQNGSQGGFGQGQGNQSQTNFNQSQGGFQGQQVANNQQQGFQGQGGMAQAGFNQTVGQSQGGQQPGFGQPAQPANSQLAGNQPQGQLFPGDEALNVSQDDLPF